MKVPLLLFACISLALSEPPPSNQYLPAGFGGGAGASLPSSQYGAPSAGGFGRGFGGGAGGLGGPGIGRPSSQYGAPGLGGAGGFPGGAGGFPGGSGGFPGGAGGFPGGAGGYSGGGGPSPQYGVPGAGRYSGRGGDYDGPSEPANYNFKYDVQAPEYGVDFGHEEGRQGDNARGKYYVLLPDGRKQTVTYTADQSGYHPEVSYTQEGSGIGAGGRGFGGGAGGYPRGGAGGFGGYPSGGPGGSDGY